MKILRSFARTLPELRETADSWREIITFCREVLKLPLRTYRYGKISYRNPGIRSTAKPVGEIPVLTKLEGPDGVVRAGLRQPPRPERGDPGGQSDDGA